MAGLAARSPAPPAGPVARDPGPSRAADDGLTRCHGIIWVALGAAIVGVTLVATMAFVMILGPRDRRRVADRPPPGALKSSPAPDVKPDTTVPPDVRDIDVTGPSAADIGISLRPLVDEIAALDSRKDGANERQAAVVRLRMYRRLCRLPDDVILDERLDEEALAAANVCRRIGALTHEPSNPGMPAAEFEKALRGARSGNLASGIDDLVRAVDGWIDDSDTANIASLGHRRWCLNPPLRRVGFGRVDTWCAMWAHDGSGSACIGVPAVCFPPAGAVPIDMFRSHYAWSVTLDPTAFRKPHPNEVRVTVQDERADTGSGPLLELDPLIVETHGYGIDNCIIFRPRGVSTAVGQRYRVVIEGIQDRTGAPVRLRYTVEFVGQVSP